MIESLLSDVRYTLRMWRRSPGFTGVAVLTLALGIGANTTMFSIVNATLLRPLPFPDADRLAMAKRYWADEEAVGKRFKIGLFASDGPWLTVVGVFKNVRQSGLDNEPGPWFLRPYNQAGWPFMSVIVKTSSAPATFVNPIKQAIAIIEPNQPVSAVRTMEGVIGTVSARRFPMLLLSGFGLLALTLAAVGIAGVVGYSVVRRTPEIGLRMALGAQRGDVLRMILGQSLTWTMIGIVGGVAAAFGLLRFLDTLLYGIEPADPVVLGAASTLLVTVAIAASYLPARRAMRIDAVRALREG